MDTQTRTMVKGGLWMLIGFIVMSLVGLLFTGSVAAGGTMALINSAIGFVTYVLYERFWARIAWGRRV